MANEAAEKVKITYTDGKTPIISIQDAIDASSFFSDQIVDQVFGDPDGKVKSFKSNSETAKDSCYSPERDLNSYLFFFPLEFVYYTAYPCE